MDHYVYRLIVYSVVDVGFWVLLFPDLYQSIITYQMFKFCYIIICKIQIIYNFNDEETKKINYEKLFNHTFVLKIS